MTFSGWPAALDVLAWSVDSELAIAVGEVVDVLVPKLHIDSPVADVESARWHRVRLTVNGFTEKELPLLEALPSAAITTRKALARHGTSYTMDDESTTHRDAFPDLIADLRQHPDNASIALDNSWVGEEQSLANAISLAWSPPGLAKYNRCALAILTSNWVLSVWATVSRPKEQTGWRRVLAVNTVLREHCKNAPSATEQNKSSSSGNSWRVRARVKAFAWAPALPQVACMDDNIPTCQENYVLVANDLGELIIIYTMKHPARSEFAANGTLTCSVDSVTPIVDASVEAACGDVLTTVPQITHVAWSAWTHDENDICISKIAYVFRDELRVRNCVASHVERKWTLRLKDNEITVKGHHKGPLQWASSVSSTSAMKIGFTDCSHVLQTTHLNLISITSDGPLCLSFDLAIKDKPPVMSQAPDPLHWQNVSGMGITSHPDSLRSLHYAPHMWYMADGQIARPLELPFMTDAPLDQSWRKSMMEDMSRFGVDNKINSKVLARVWGLGASPLGDHVAICHSLHPSDMVQYAMASEQDYRLLISVESDHLPVVHRLETTSAETMLFSVSRWVERRHPLSVTDFEELQTWILAIIKQRDLKCSNDSPIKLKQQINTRVSFRLHVLDAVRNANRHLEQTGGETTRALELTIALSTGILTLSAKFCDENNVSWRIVRNHQCTLHLMAERGAAIDSALLSGIDAAGDNHETCEICSATIPFKDNTWARCQRGHQFGEFQGHIVSHPH